MGGSLKMIEKLTRDTVTCEPYEGPGYGLKPSGIEHEHEHELREYLHNCTQILKHNATASFTCRIDKEK